MQFMYVELFCSLVFPCLLWRPCSSVLFTSQAVQTRFLNFIPSTSSQQQSTFQWSDAFPDTSIVVYASSREAILVDIMSRVYKPLNITMLCLVDRLFPDYSIVQYHWCHQKQLNSTAPLCSELTDAPHVQSIQNSHSGAIVSIYQEKTIDEDLSGFYFCRLTNKNGQLDSAMLQIRDFDYQRRQWASKRLSQTNLVSKYTYYDAAIIEPKDLPLTFSCGQTVNGSLLPPSGLPEETLPFMWYFFQEPVTGDVVRLDECNCGIDRYAENHISLSGTLTIMRLNFNTPRRAFLLCKRTTDRFDNKFIHAIASRKSGMEQMDLQFNPTGSAYHGIPKIMAKSPDSSLQLRAGEFSRAFRLTVIYRAPTNVRGRWSKDNRQLPSGFHERPFHLEFPLQLTLEHSGIYRFHIGDDIAVFPVQVVSPPLIRDVSQPRETHLMTGSSLHIKYTIDSVGESIKKFYINGLREVDLTSPRALGTSVNSLTPRLNVVISPLGEALKTSSTVTYSVSSLINNERGSHSHSVMFTVANEHGVSRSTNIVKVLPYPHIQKAPKDHRCKTRDCDPTERQTFQCQFNAYDYHLESIIFRRVWYFNSELIHLALNGTPSNLSSSWEHFFKLENENETLYLEPTEKFPEMQNKLVGGSIRCRILLLTPAAQQLPNTTSLETILASNYLIYDSDKDKYLATRFATRIYYQHEPGTAAMAAILGISLSLLVILIVALMVVHFLRRQRVETYEVENEELNHGLNPKEESRDNCFHTYERGDDTIERNCYENGTLRSSLLMDAHAGVMEDVDKNANEDDEIFENVTGKSNCSLNFYPHLYTNKVSTLHQRSISDTPADEEDI